MQVKCSKKTLPRIWFNHPHTPLIDGEFDIPLGSLFAKLIVFKNPTDLKRFWNGGSGPNGRLGKLQKGKTLGAVNGLYREVWESKSNTSFLEVDRRYFCCIGLCRKYLTMEIISHEAVHAAFCFIKRKSRTPWDIHAKTHDEEAVAYPAGRLAAAINRVLHKHQLY